MQHDRMRVQSAHVKYRLSQCDTPTHSHQYPRQHLHSMRRIFLRSKNIRLPRHCPFGNGARSRTAPLISLDRHAQAMLNQRVWNYDRGAGCRAPLPDIPHRASTPRLGAFGAPRSERCSCDGTAPPSHTRHVIARRFDAHRDADASGCSGNGLRSLVRFRRKTGPYLVAIRTDRGHWNTHGIIRLA